MKSIHETMHDLGASITKDIMAPILKDFNKDIKRIEQKLDLVIHMLKGGNEATYKEDE
jgi:hypothetical protein